MYMRGAQVRCSKHMSSTDNPPNAAQHDAHHWQNTPAKHSKLTTVATWRTMTKSSLTR